MVHFDGSGSHDPDGTIVSYRWSFGDGTSAGTMVVNHAYATTGNFTVTLTVTDNGGKQGTDQPVMHVRVGAYNGTYALTPNPTQQVACMGGTVVFVSTRVHLRSSNNETTLTSDWEWPSQNVTVSPRPARGPLNGALFIGNWTEAVKDTSSANATACGGTYTQTATNAWVGTFDGLGGFTSFLTQGLTDDCPALGGPTYNCSGASAVNWNVAGNYIGPP